MSEFLDRISRLSPQRLALLADELNERLQAAERRRRVPLAIVGIGCRLPGGVHSPEEFWNLLSQGVDAVGEVPSSRWNIEEFYDSNPDTPGKMATRWGGFIEGHDQFDPKFFGIAPAEAACMDPQQRLLLETTWEALEHAGIAPAKISGTSAGVFVGICNGDYGQVAFNSAREEITPYFASGLSHAVASGRISYVLGLQGPSLAVDTSCSASLVAVHLACQSLRLGECEMALAGGVNLIFNPDVTIALSQSKMMAPDGRCKAFSDSANGFVRGEGCGMIVLKRLPNAIRDRNRILAVIRGSACNQDGRSSGLTAPNGPSQEAVIAAALADAGMQPDEVDFIEAHGTGTTLGDPIEAGALNTVFATESRKSDPLFVGSVKTNLGHLESAAGIAGLIKLVLSIQHGKIPASLHFDKPSGHIEWDRLPLKIPAELKTWKPRRQKRVGGVSSFGFSGTNAHVIVEEYPEVEPSATAEDRTFLFTLSARTRSALAATAARLHRHLMEYPSLPLGNIAHTLSAGRSHFEYRAAFTAASHKELRELLDRLRLGEKVAAIPTGRAAVHAPRVSFIFGDGGFHRQGMSRELYDKAPAFREAVERCEEILRNEWNAPLEMAWKIGREDGIAEKAENPAASKIAAFVAQYALAGLWRACGIEPAAVSGHGVDAYVAACVAGIFDLQDGLRLAVADATGNSTEFNECARNISFQEPRIPFISGSNEKSAHCANYWLQRSQADISSQLSLAVLAKDSNAIHLYIGNAFELAECSEKRGENATDQWLASLGARGDCREFLNAAAALYVVGCELELDGFYRNAAPTVSLPTYPFERERYWIESKTPREVTKVKPLDADADIPRAKAAVSQSAEYGDEWVYDLVWQTKPSAQKLSPAMAAELDENLLHSMSRTPATAELMRVEQLMELVMPTYATYILQAFREAGLSILPTSEFTLDELCRQLKVIPPRRRVLSRMLGMLAEDKIVEEIGDRFRFVNFEPRPDPDRELERLGEQFPECLAETNVLRRCGKKLSAVLQGAYDPMQLVFADGSIEEAEQIYEHSPVCRFFNDNTAKVIRAIVDQIAGRPARILEIGAGTGATTRPVLAGLAGAQTEVDYTFTDVSPVFLSRARNKFSQFPSISYRVLDIESDPGAQGFQPGQYDIILAANVLHATADLRRTIAHAHSLLAPGGFVLLLEGVRPDRWLELTFGLTDGWWRFTDLDLRSQHPLISAEAWTDLLREAGMNFSRTISYVREDGVLSHQRLIVAQADAEPKKSLASFSGTRREWIIFADDFGIGDALQKSLAAQGEKSEIARRPGSSREVSETLRHLETRVGDAALKVVYLWDVDAAELGLVGIETLSQEAASTPALIHLIQSLLKSRTRNAHLWIATRGAQATKTSSPGIGGAIQSMAWGVGRVLSVESPEIYRALIDLDPALSPEAAASDLLVEILSGNKEDQVVYRGGQRFVPRLQHSHLRSSAAPTSTFTGLREDSAYLLVGGLGGVGLRLARWAAEQCAGHLVLLSRTGLGKKAGVFAEERLQAVEAIQKLGVKVTIVEGDVASATEMKALFHRFGRDLPVLRGIFHAATEVNGAVLAEMTDSQIEGMLRVKVSGALMLHELSQAMPLDFFLAFSSTTSVLGARGMAHYAAANQFLDSFAHYRRASGLPMLSVNWGAWDVMRLVTPENRNSLKEAGMLPMSSEKLLQRMGELVASPRAQVMIADIDWQTLKPLFEVNRDRPLLELMGGAPSKRESTVASAIPAQSSLHATLDLSPENRKKYIEAFVVEQAARVLGYRADESLPMDAALIDIGLDSLMAVDLKNRLQIALGQELSPTVIFDYPTVFEIAGMLDARLWASQGNSEDHLALSQKDEIRI